MIVFGSTLFAAIAGGVLSGVAVVWISFVVLAKRERSDYARRVAAVNREVMASASHGLVQGHIPSTDVLSALIASTCRKHEVALADAFDIHTLSEELVKVVMDSSFIEPAAKQECCNKLLALQQLAQPRYAAVFKAAEVEKQPAGQPTLKSIRTRTLGQMSAIHGVLVATLTAFLTVIKYRFDIQGAETTPSFSLPLLIIMAAAFSVVAVYLASVISREAWGGTHRHEHKGDHADAHEDYTG